MNVRFLEGYFIVTDDDHIFEVKGNVHPKNRVIAYLRYVPSSDGERCSADGIRYRKVYLLHEREAYLSERHPEYLWYDHAYGRVMQGVPTDRIAFVLNPVVCLSEIKDTGAHLNRLQKASLKLAQRIVDGARLEWSDVGITGSQLVGLSRADSDIDLVVYGSLPAQRVFLLLQGCDESLGIRRYSGERLNRHVDFRWGKQNTWWHVMREIEERKVLQGEFDSYDFFIRNVKLQEETASLYGGQLVTNEGIQRIRGRIVDDQDAIFTPCTYCIECVENSMFKRIVSYRGKFTEQTQKGMMVEARGRAELVVLKRTREEFMQLVLGEDLDDYLVPTS